MIAVSSVSKQVSKHVLRAAALAVVCLAAAACSPNISVVTFTPQATIAPTGTLSPAVANAVSNADAGKSPCIGTKDPTTNPPTGGSSKQYSAPDNVTDKSHTYCAIIVTNKGRMVAQLFPAIAPLNTNSFVFLANKGFYDGITWHRVISDFMAQTGDPTGTGSGGPGYNNLPIETIASLKYDRPGRIGMARTNDPNSAGSQFFITYVPYPSLDTQYTIIGQVVEGMNVLTQIAPRDPQSATTPGDPLVSVRVVDLGVAQ